MSSSTPKSAYWEGFRAGAPFVLVVGPFAMLFGVVATEAGLTVAETLAFSVAVIAGANEFAAQTAQLKNLQSGESEEVSLSEGTVALVARIRAIVAAG